MRWVPLFTVCIAVLLAGCGRAQRTLSPHEGYVEVPGGKVWYRVVGSGPRTPLLVLHGGPGAPSYYLKPLAALADERPVVFYDQLGAGRSDHPTDTTLWTIDRFVEELAAVRQELKLKEVHVYGHSWGAMLAMEYFLTHPSGIRSLVLASPPLSIPLWIHDADSLRATLPDSIQQAITLHEREGTVDSPEYQAAMMYFFQQFGSRSKPWSPDIDSTLTQLGQSVYHYMWGPSEFTITGTLRDYDRIDRLHEIDVPTLFTAGRYDEATPSTVGYFHSLVPGSRFVVFERSAHMTVQDEPVKYTRAIRDFLRDVDKH